MKYRHLKELLATVIIGFILTLFSYFMAPITPPVGYFYFVGHTDKFHGSPWSYYSTYPRRIDVCTFYKKDPRLENVYTCDTEFQSEIPQGFKLNYFILDFVVWSLITVLVLLSVRLLSKFYSRDYLLPAIVVCLVSINLVFVFQISRELSELRQFVNQRVGSQEIEGLREANKGFSNPPTGLYEETQRIIDVLISRMDRQEDALKSICNMVDASCVGLDNL